MHLEGIFRKCGSNKRIKDIKKLLDSHGNVIDWSEQEEFTVHDAASVLKQYVAELPEPLLCDKHIPIHIEIASKCWEYGAVFVFCFSVINIGFKVARIPLILVFSVNRIITMNHQTCT